MPKQKKLLHPLFQKLLKAPFSALERRTGYFRLRRRRLRHERVGGYYWLDAGIVYGMASNPFLQCAFLAPDQAWWMEATALPPSSALGPKWNKRGDDENAPLCIP